MAVDIGSLAIGFLIAILQVIVGLALSMAAVYLGMKMFDKLTKGIEEMREIQKGNVAVGILMIAVILSIATVVKAGVLSLVLSINPSVGMQAMVLAILVGLFNLVISIVVSIIAIYLAVKIAEKITVEINFMKEIQKGNVAVAVVLGGILWAVSFVLSATVESVANFLDARALAAIIGVG
jgi:uncharacterized membrane protein YjfL (UPF0719 family)